MTGFLYQMPTPVTGPTGPLTHILFYQVDPFGALPLTGNYGTVDGEGAFVEGPYGSSFQAVRRFSAREWTGFLTDVATAAATASATAYENGAFRGSDLKAHLDAWGYEGGSDAWEAANPEE